jgi:thiol-disulfide isomerase/thioredoxin
VKSQTRDATGRARLERVSGSSGVLVVVAALLASTGAGILWKRRNGKFRESPPVRMDVSRAQAHGLDVTLAGLGVTPHTPVTLLQFSSAFCAPCRTTRVLCADVSAHVPGVRHVEVDAESHLDAVRALDIWRTPTLLIVDGQGQVRRRASGAPSRAQLMAAVAEVLPQTGLGTSAAHG